VLVCLLLWETLKQAHVTRNLHISTPSKPWYVYPLHFQVSMFESSALWHLYPMHTMQLVDSLIMWTKFATILDNVITFMSTNVICFTLITIQKSNNFIQQWIVGCKTFFKLHCFKKSCWFILAPSCHMHSGIATDFTKAWTFSIIKLSKLLRQNSQINTFVSG